jgi:hypothetical protein
MELRSSSEIMGWPRDAKAYGVVDGIAARTFANGGTVVGVRQDDVPGAKSRLRSCAIRFESAEST